MDIKNGNSIIKVSKQTYNGKDYIDIRKMYQDENEEWKPTKKGISFNPELLKEIIKALQSL